MNCEQAGEKVADFALGSLEGEQRACLVAHLSGCPSCQAEVSALTGVVDALINLAPLIAGSPGFAEKVISGLPPHPSGPTASAKSARRRWPKRAIGTAMLVAVLAGAGVIGTASRHGDRPQPQATIGAHARAAVLRVVSMRTPAGMPVGSAVAFYGPRAWVYVSVTLPATASGTYLSGRFGVVLVHRDGQLTPLGRVTVQHGQGSLDAPARVPLSQIGSVDVIDARGGDVCAGLLSGGSLLHTGGYAP